MNVTEEMLELAQKFVLCSKYYNKVLNIGLTFFNLIGLIIQHFLIFEKETLQFLMSNRYF